MKYNNGCPKRINIGSPSMRREWIEIKSLCCLMMLSKGLPPCGGSGLKCITASVFQSVTKGLPPCGGSGLKFLCLVQFVKYSRSPSMRREWIEIRFPYGDQPKAIKVSLHAEGVD